MEQGQTRESTWAVVLMGNSPTELQVLPNTYAEEATRLGLRFDSKKSTGMTVGATLGGVTVGMKGGEMLKPLFL